MSKEFVEFLVPFLPISVNAIYGFKTGRRGVKVFMKDEARQFKEKAKLFMPPRTVGLYDLLEVHLQFRGKWWNKCGTVRRFDIQNLEKILIDSIAERYDFDDSRVWRKEASKVEGEDGVSVKLFRLEVQHGQGL